jgi:hypothetical protein
MLAIQEGNALMAIGLVHMVVIGFEGNRFTGEIFEDLDFT